MWWAYPILYVDVQIWKPKVFEANDEGSAETVVDNELPKWLAENNHARCIPIACVRGPFFGKGEAERSCDHFYRNQLTNGRKDH